MIISLARASLIYEWRRFLPATLAITFAGLLMLIQLGLLLGMLSAVSVYIDRSSADLWVGFPGTQSIDIPYPIPEKIRNKLLMHPEVEAVERFAWSFADWQRPSGGKISAILVSIDTNDKAMSFSKLLTPEKKALLKKPGTIIVDESDLNKLDVSVGDFTELSGKRVEVVATVNGMRSVTKVNILSSFRSGRVISPRLLTNDIDYYLIKLKKPERAEIVRDQLQPTGSYKTYQVWTAAEFSYMSMRYWLLESGAGSGFLFSSLLGLIVGIVITSQTFLSAIMASVREYATLRALGVSIWSLSKVILEQSLWIGLTGWVLISILTLLIIACLRYFYVPFILPNIGIVIIYSLIMLITFMSGGMTIRYLKRVEPFTLLR